MFGGNELQVQELGRGGTDRPKKAMQLGKGPKKMGNTVDFEWLIKV